MAAKIAIWQPQRDALYIFEKNASWETAWLVSDWFCKRILKTSKEKVSNFLWNIPDKSSKHRHFTRQIAFTRNHLVPILSDFWNPKFHCSDWLDLKLTFKLSKSWKRRTCKINFLSLNISPPFFEEKTATYPWPVWHGSYFDEVHLKRSSSNVRGSPKKKSLPHKREWRSRFLPFWSLSLIEW